MVASWATYPFLSNRKVNINVNVLYPNEKRGFFGQTFRKQSSLYLHGASGTGKTWFVSDLKRMRLGEMREIGPSVGHETNIIDNNEITDDEGKPIVIGDHSGDPSFFAQKSRAEYVHAQTPLGIIRISSPDC